MFKNMSIKSKLFMFPITLAVLLVIIFGLYHTKNARIESLNATNELASSLNTDYLDTRIRIYQLLRGYSDDGIKRVQDNMDKNKKQISELKGRLKLQENIQRMEDNLKLFGEYEDKFKYYCKVVGDEQRTGVKSDVNTSQLVKEWAGIGAKIQKNTEDMKKSVTTVVESEMQAVYTTMMIGYIIAFVIFIGLSLIVIAQVTGSVAQLSKGMDSFFRFLSRESSKAETIQIDSTDELGQMAKVINQNISKIEKELELDNAVLTDAQVVINRVNNGWYSQFIEARTTNTSLEGFKSNVNTMLKNTRQRFIEVDEVLETYAKFDYTRKLDMRSTDERGGVFERLVHGVNEMQTAVTQMLKDNLENGYDLLGNSSNLTQMVEELSNSSNEQAASLEETAASLEEITSVIRETATRANDMSKISGETKKSADHGMSLTNRTASVMDEITRATTAINESVAVIENIAFQTNILSLNAAVEAATAGEAGKGFAVVAQEVRNLANRSADAAKAIKELAVAAQSKTVEGKQASDDMISGFRELSQKIDNTTRLIEDVASATKEQMSGVEQINDAVAQLDRMTQENAAAAAQTGIIAETVARMANDLVDDANKKQFSGKDSVRSGEGRSMPGQALKSSPRPVVKLAHKPAALPKPTGSGGEWDSF
jgi:methyl-accepting chemotaxis protein